MKNKEKRKAIRNKYLESKKQTNNKTKRTVNT